MAARTIKIRHDEETRAKIRTSQLINRLESHVFDGVKISQTQLKAIEVLLRKSLPDLTSTTISGNEDEPIRHVLSWKNATSLSTTPPESNSSPSTNETSGLPALSPIDEPEKP